MSIKGWADKENANIHSGISFRLKKGESPAVCDKVLEDIIQSEISQSQKDKHRGIPLTQGI